MDLRDTQEVKPTGFCGRGQREALVKNGSKVDSSYNKLIGDAMGWNRKHWTRTSLRETVQCLQVQFEQLG